MNFESTRREFLQTVIAGLAMGRSMLLAQESSPAGLPTRPLGKTGERVSIIGLGGWDIGAIRDEKEAIAIMHEAIDNGLTFFDNCWDYHNGGSEERMGKALAQNGYRDKVFLMTKVCGRDYKTARQNLEDSLRRLRTDRIDLWQFHGIQWNDDPDLIFAENGALKCALEARKAGKIRYIGFTGHKNPRFHLAMLAKPFEWDTVQMPINILDAHYESFQKQVLPVCVKRNIGAIGMKALASQGGRLPRELGIPAPLLRRFALSLPISSLICGIQSRENLRQDIEMARNFRPLADEEVQELLAKAAGPAATGQIEQYKVGNYGCDWWHNLAKRS
ncbi:aldo/keto reductase [Thermogutta sp.]|jgi:aryl-alcohol dehydrogenase-like predicted oxidoreductase|uniref:aldo/keto reductase n=1 Tax=Thermogutta sp. TaxID=1962930 RepID=UPI00321FF4F0